MDKQLKLLHTVEGLEYVYWAQVSPDERKLLLISNSNKFYTVDLQSFEKTRISVKAPYNHNLSGLGCWSFDGKHIWIPVNRSTGYINSTLRCYCAEDLSKYEDYLPDKYCITGISRIDNAHSYFLTGYNRKENNSHYFIFFDGTVFREYPLDPSVDMVAPSAAVDTQKGIVTITSVAGCQQFSLDGKLLDSVPHPAPQSKTVSASDGFMHLFDGDPEKRNKLKALSAALGLDHIPVPDFITKYELSHCGSYIYLASQSGFYLLDAGTGVILASVSEAYGVQSFEELAPGLLALATWSGVKLYRYDPQ